MFTSPACGRPQAKGFQNKSSFTKRRRRISANSTRDMREATLSIVIAEMERFRTSAVRPALKWAAGPGPRISGTSIMTATPTCMSPKDTLTERTDMASFFWRQVVAKSSEDATGALAYERGWNAINELVRSDSTWHGYARNVMFANNRDGTFSEVSGPVGLDFLEDSRTFGLADLDHDGRLEVILKNRNAPQLRIVHNAMKDIGRSIAFRLRGHTSNRDAIGAAITVESGAHRQTKYLQAGSGFLTQHSKELFFGVGETRESVDRKST